MVAATVEATAADSSGGAQVREEFMKLRAVWLQGRMVIAKYWNLLLEESPYNVKLAISLVQYYLPGILSLVR